MKKTGLAAPKRLLVATLAAILLLWLLGFLTSLITGPAGTNLGTFLGYLDPLNLLVTAIAMGVGGYLEGKRFIGMALLVMVAFWVVTVVILLQIAKPLQDAPLVPILAFNRMQMVFSALAACAGAAIGAWLRMKRPPRIFS
jgi:hypothetical protein